MKTTNTNDYVQFSSIASNGLLVNNDCYKELNNNQGFYPKNISPYLNFEDFWFHIRHNFGDLLAELRFVLHQFRNDISAPEAFLIKNVPVGELPDTPLNDSEIVNKTNFVSEAFLLSIAQVLREVFSYKEEKNRALIHNIFPQIHKQEECSSSGSDADFEFHTELAFCEYRPDYVILICLRQNFDNTKAYTTLSKVGNALAHVQPKTLAILQEPLFIIGAPKSFDLVEPELAKSPLITSSNGYYEACVNFNNMKAINNEAENALNDFKNALHSKYAQHKVFLECGDVLIINNKKAVHGRTRFAAHFDGADRWLQRVYVKSTPQNGKFVSNEIKSRVLGYSNKFTLFK